MQLIRVIVIYLFIQKSVMPFSPWYEYNFQPTPIPNLFKLYFIPRSI